MDTTGQRGAVSTARNPAALATAPLRVLVVDADGDTRELYRRSLAAAGLHVHEAVDGRDALVQIHAVSPQAVVLDARLPYIDGVQLCSLLKRDTITANLRLIAITSDSTPEHLRRLADGGADAVFVKPVPVDAVVATVCGAVPEGAVTFQDEDVAARPPRVLSRARMHERYVSSTPPAAPPRLRCPQCDGELQYERSHVGGVSERHPEQWDYYSCTTHGRFQYRHRTRKLRRAS